MRPLLSRVLVLAVLTLGFSARALADHHEAGDAVPEAAPAAHEWDQAKVTAIAETLANDVRGLRNSARSQPPDNLASGQSRARMRLLDELRLIERETRSLHSELAKGEGRDTTRPIFRRIDELRRSAAEDARRMFLPKATLDQIQASRGALEELRVFYGGPADDRDDLHGPSSDDSE